MNVLHVNSYYATSRLYRHLYAALAAIGVQQRVFVPLPRGFATVLEAGTVPIDEARILGLEDRIFSSIKARRCNSHAEKLYSESRFDAIHAHSLFTNGRVANALGAKWRLPYVVTVRNTDLNVFFAHMIHLRALGRRLLRDASKIIFLSPAYRDSLVSRYLTGSLAQEVLAKSEIIPNGVESFWLENTRLSAPPNQTCIKLISVGRVDSNKNAIATVRAMRLLRARGVSCHLTLVGSLSDRALARRLKRLKDVTLTGPLDHQDLLEQYRSADIFVLPSKQESFGLVYAEALTQGLPVVYSRGEGFDRHFAEGDVGYSVRATEPGDIAAAIERIVSAYPAFSSRCVNACARFDWGRIGAEHGVLYESASSRG